ncbi:MAG: MFS transporter, partial [Bacteroidales bacterium]|nr:MFS transporter [Bacteroidales bacterium]
MILRMNNKALIIFINLMFLQIGLLVSIMSALIPEIIRSFQISYGLASLLPFAFYIALSLSCIPAGIAGEKYTAKNIIVFAFLYALVGILVFTLFLNYQASVSSLFIIGSSTAIIQVTAVPLLRRACGPENIAFHLTLNQLMYGMGAFLSPVIYSWLTKSLLNDTGANNLLVKTLSRIIPQGFEWVSAYLLFIILLISLITIVLLIKFPEREETHNSSIIRNGVYLELFRNKYVILYFFSLMAYASCEQGIATWMSKF